MQNIITIIISVLSASGLLGIGTKAILIRQKAVESGVQAIAP